jgi:hypothetical protein
MRTFAALSVCVLIAVVLFQERSSAVPTTRLVSPPLAFNANQRLVCDVTNADTTAHTVHVQFYDSTGTVVSGNPPLPVPAHGSTGVSFPPGAGASHCEITADGRRDDFRASLYVIDTTVAVQPLVVAAIPFN